MAKWHPPSAFQMISSWDGRFTIKRRLYDNGEASHWWIEYKATLDAPIVTLKRHSSSLWFYATLEEAKQRVEDFESGYY